MNLIAWLLTALFPVLILFSLFPGSTVSVKVVGVSATGAAGMFLFLWWYGTRSGLSAKEIDQKTAQLRTKESRIKALEQELATYQAAPKPRALDGIVEYMYKVKDTTKRIGL